MKFRVTYVLIALNVLFYALGWSWPLNVQENWATAILYGFSHANGLHLAFNMLALLTFGIGVERAIGATDMLALYLGSIVFGALAQSVFGDGTPTVGASAGIFALLVAYAVCYPDKRVMLLVFPMRAQVLLWLYVGIELVLAVTHWVPGIAHAAHIGGAVAAGVFMLFRRWENGN